MNNLIVFLTEKVNQIWGSSVTPAQLKQVEEILQRIEKNEIKFELF